MQQITVGVREAKARFSELLRYAKAGQKIIVTERGMPVARIVRVEKEAITVANRLHEFRQQGLITPLGNKKAVKVTKPIKVPGISAQKLLQEDRDSTWQAMTKQ